METDSRTLCDSRAQGRFHLILSSHFAFLPLPFSLLIPFYLYFLHLDDLLSLLPVDFNFLLSDCA